MDNAKNSDDSVATIDKKMPPRSPRRCPHCNRNFLLRCTEAEQNIHWCQQNGQG